MLICMVYMSQMNFAVISVKGIQQYLNYSMSSLLLACKCGNCVHFYNLILQ